MSPPVLLYKFFSESDKQVVKNYLDPPLLYCSYGINFGVQRLTKKRCIVDSAYIEALYSSKLVELLISELLVPEMLFPADVLRLDIAFNKPNHTLFGAGVNNSVITEYSWHDIKRGVCVV